jgi:ribonuclease HI
LIGLRGALEIGARDIEVRADSELMIKQLKGEYRVKNEGLKPLFAEAVALLKQFEKVKLRHVPREENKLADEMSNRAIDEKM